MSSESGVAAFRTVPRTGVIFVTAEAQKRGFTPQDPAWCNLGQGQPDTGELPGAPSRVASVAIDPGDQEYAPVAGLWELRETIASHYNRLYRRGLPSQYTAENVSISGGGRAALTRAAASLGPVNLGHFLPDYTAYEELLDIFRSFTSIPILLEPETAYAFGPEALRKEIAADGARPVGATRFQPCQSNRQSGGRRGARGLGAPRALAGLRAAHRRVLRPLRVGGAHRSAECCRLRARHEQGPGGALRRADQELALPGLARHLDGGAEVGHRGGGQRGLLPRWRREQAAATRGQIRRA